MKLKSFNFKKVSIEKDIYLKNIIKRDIMKPKSKNEDYNCLNNIYKYRNTYFFSINSSYIMITIFLIFNNLINNISLNVNVHSSIITIKINETGLQKIYNDRTRCHSGKFDPPDEIIINNEKQNSISAIHYFETTDNIIQLKWNEKRENWGCLFQNCIKITY